MDTETKIAAMQATINRLSDFIRSQALCPCCEEYEVCDPQCTLHDDCYDEWQRVKEARRVLRGDDGPA
jgi:hypothetical protein